MEEEEEKVKVKVKETFEFTPSPLHSWLDREKLFFFTILIFIFPSSFNHTQVESRLVLSIRPI